MDAIAAAEPIRLVVWDLDETFWHGTLTEGGITWRPECRDIVVTLARRGIMSTICSKNDPAAVERLLTEHGLWEYFIFPSIDWQPKGPRLLALIEAVGLRPATVLFIDDNPHNLAEAAHYVSAIQLAGPDILPRLLDDPLCRGKDDPDLTRLAQYRLLQTRHAAAASAPDARDFLRESAITVEIDFDLSAHLDRAIELINRTNQLNFTKRRLPEDQAAASKMLAAMLANQDYPGGIIRVRDRYGDYGYCGLFVLHHSRAKPRALVHFCFSCRILNMGVEDWLYQRLGRPALTIVGDVLGDPAARVEPVDWISLAQLASGTEHQAPPARMLDVVYARGTCHVRPLSHYFSMVAHEVVEDFDTVRNGRTMPLNHSIFAHYALHGVPAGAQDAFARLGYVDSDFTSFFTDPPPGARMLWVLNFWTEAGANLYRHRATGALIPIAFNPQAAKAMYAKLGRGANDYRNWDRDAPGVDAGVIDTLVRDFDYVGRTPDDVLQAIVAAMIARAPATTMVVVLLANEQTLTADGSTTTAEWVRRVNHVVRAAASPFPQAVLLDMREAILSNDDLVVGQPLKFQRAVFFRLYEAIMARWNAQPREQHAAEHAPGHAPGHAKEARS